MSTHDFFFSYRKSDADLVRNLANWCRASGISVWLDEDSIPITDVRGEPLSGERWKDFVEMGINGAHHIFLFTNERWVNSDACRTEGTLALAHASHATSRVLRICLGACGDVEAAFPPLGKLPRHSYSDENAFAEFVLKHCGTKLRTEFSPAVLADATRNGVVCRGRYVSIRAWSFRSISEGVLKRDPMRCLNVLGIKAFPESSTLDLKLSYSPFFKYVGFEGTVLPQTSHGPRIDEEIQAAYRQTAVAFFSKHRDWTWRGTHQVWRNGICHFSLTYLIPPDHHLGDLNQWGVERLFSMPWQQEFEHVTGEIHFGFRKLFPNVPDADELAVFHLEADAVFQSMHFEGKTALQSIDRRLMTTFVLTLAASVLILAWNGFVSNANTAIPWCIAAWIIMHTGTFISDSNFRRAQEKEAFLWYPSLTVLLPLMIPCCVAFVAIAWIPQLLSVWWKLAGCSAAAAWLRCGSKAMKEVQRSK